MSSLPRLIGFDEFPVGYSSAGCPPAEPTSASPTGNDSQQPTLPYNDFSANVNNPLNFVSHPKGASQSGGLSFIPTATRNEADQALIVAHNILLEVLRVQDDRFKVLGLGEQLEACKNDFLDIYRKASKR